MIDLRKYERIIVGESKGTMYFFNSCHKRRYMCKIKVNLVINLKIICFISTKVGLL